MKEIKVEDITAAVKKICIDSNYFIGDDVLRCFNEGLKKEVSPSGKQVLQELIDNARIAREEQVPMCQDTGAAVIFVEAGQDAHITGGSLIDAINEGVRQGYRDGYLRKSMLNDPIKRVNTKDNTPAIIHTEIVPGDKLKITVAPKGAGSENMSALLMLKPSDGLEGIKKFIIDVVKKAGSNPCPPIVLGIGIGGTMEKAAFMAKKALIRSVGEPSKDPETAALEKEILELVNKTGIGPAGLGGKVTALAVHIEKYPCHIASLPVAVNINCHAARHKEAIL